MVPLLIFNAAEWCHASFYQMREKEKSKITKKMFYRIMKHLATRNECFFFKFQKQTKTLYGESLEEISKLSMAGVVL